MRLLCRNGTVAAHRSTGASFLAAPIPLSFQPVGIRPRDSPNAVVVFLGKRLLPSFNPLSGHRSGLRIGLLWLSALTVPTTPSADFSTVFSARCQTPSFDTLKHRGDLPG